ncbi:MAG TPA: serine protease, partial [Bacteroidales bacterium]|nr:serine protease [Bacteroidales bacterium]
SSDSQYTEMLGQTGETYTILRPAGKVMINGKMFDAVAQTGYIDKGEAVRIVKYENAQLIVRKV